jgi:DNA invertase Pin-like site-specific DNA recombinase
MAPHFGYIRVSSVDQNIDRQLEGLDFEEVFTDKVSAKNMERPALKECMRHLRKGDTLHVHSIDRLARNLFDLQKIVSSLTEKGIAVHFHKETLVFTGQDDAMQKLQLQMMGAFAEFERSLIRERQREGIAAAKAKGKHLGRPGLLDDQQKAEIREKRMAGSTPTALGKKYGVSRATIYNIIKENA